MQALHWKQTQGEEGMLTGVGAMGGGGVGGGGRRHVGWDGEKACGVWGGGGQGGLLVGRESMSGLGGGTKACLL